MKPGVEWGQVISLLGILLRKPVLTFRTNLRLLARGLAYLADNPDLVWARYLMVGGRPTPPGSLVLVMDKGRPVFSFVLAGKVTGNLPTVALPSLEDLDSFREKLEKELQRPLQLIQLEAAIIDRFKLKVIEERKLDAFFIAGREIIRGLSEDEIKFSPIIIEAEMGGSLDGEELLAKFGPRFGLSMENPVSFSKMTRGLWLALAAPITRRRMKRELAAYLD